MAAPGSATSKPGASPGGGRRSLAAAIGCISVAALAVRVAVFLVLSAPNSFIVQFPRVFAQTTGPGSSPTPSNSGITGVHGQGLVDLGRTLAISP